MPPRHPPAETRDAGADASRPDGAQDGGQEPADSGDPLLALAKAAADGDRDQLVRLLALVAGPVAAVVRVLLGAQHPDIEDAVQDALIAIADSVRRFRGESSFLHYARRVAVRTALGARRSHRAGARRLALAVDHASAEPPAATIAPADAIEREQRLEAFRRLLDELPEGQAESLTYRVLLEHPLDVIARATGVPVNTVRSRIRLARDHLRERILHDPTLSELLKEPS